MVGEDVDGQTYDFRFRFWLNNQSRMYLIEGCLEMIKKYKLQKGDVIVFARKGDGTLVVGGRPAGPVRPPLPCMRARIPPHMLARCGKAITTACLLSCEVGSIEPGMQRPEGRADWGMPCECTRLKRNATRHRCHSACMLRKDGWRLVVILCAHACIPAKTVQSGVSVRVGKGWCCQWEVKPFCTTPACRPGQDLYASLQWITCAHAQLICVKSHAADTL